MSNSIHIKTFVFKCNTQMCNFIPNINSLCLLILQKHKKINWLHCASLSHYNNFHSVVPCLWMHLYCSFVCMHKCLPSINMDCTVIWAFSCFILQSHALVNGVLSGSFQSDWLIHSSLHQIFIQHCLIWRRAKTSKLFVKLCLL